MCISIYDKSNGIEIENTNAENLNKQGSRYYHNCKNTL